VLQPSPLKEISSQDYEGGEDLGNKEWSLNHIFGLSGMKVSLITFLILGSGTCLLSVRIAGGNKLQCGVSFDDHNMTKRMNKAFEFPCKTIRTRLDDNQDSKKCTWSE
jgi:hypothetical protein